MTFSRWPGFEFNTFEAGISRMTARAGVSLLLLVRWLHVPRGLHYLESLFRVGQRFLGRYRYSWFIYVI